MVIYIDCGIVVKVLRGCSIANGRSGQDLYLHVTIFIKCQKGAPSISV